MLNMIGIKEMHIQTTMRYQEIPIKVAKIKRLTVPSVGEDVEQLELSHCWWEDKTVKPF